MTSYAPTQQAEITDLELDTILRIAEVVQAQALIYADDQEDQVVNHLQDSFDDVKRMFIEFNEPDDRTHVVFDTVYSMVLAA